VFPSGVYHSPTSSGPARASDVGRASSPCAPMHRGYGQSRRPTGPNNERQTDTLPIPDFLAQAVGQLFVWPTEHETGQGGGAIRPVALPCTQPLSRADRGEMEDGVGQLRVSIARSVLSNLARPPAASVTSSCASGGAAICGKRTVRIVNWPSCSLAEAKCILAREAIQRLRQMTRPPEVGSAQFRSPDTLRPVGRQVSQWTTNEEPCPVPSTITATARTARG
jgi:hypothetical protein